MNDRGRIYDIVNNYTYYILIGLLSLLAAFLLPMLGSSIEGGFNLPNNAAGWAVFIITKTIAAVINVLLLVCFVNQGKLNVRNDPKYIEALDILGKVKEQKKRLPRSPEKYYGAVYGKKGTTIFVSSALSTFSLTQAILTFDWVSLLTYGFVVLVGVIFGVMQMKKTELYWTEEFLAYAKSLQEDKNNDRVQRETIS